MFASVTWLHDRLLASVEPVGTLYVESFDAELAAAALWLSKRLGKRVWSRISERNRRAELRTIWGALVATVKVEGECCTPCVAVVTSDLSVEHQKIFDRLFEIRVVHRGFPD